MSHWDSSEGTEDDMMADGSSPTTSNEEESPVSKIEVMVRDFWENVNHRMTQLSMEDFRCCDLPLARIKKIMKLDENVKMISAEAPIVLSKAADLFIQELTLRAWASTVEGRRRTLQRGDVSTAASLNEQFDFLIDILPRDEPVRSPTIARGDEDPFDEEPQETPSCVDAGSFSFWNAPPELQEQQANNSIHGNATAAIQDISPYYLLNVADNQMMPTSPSDGSIIQLTPEQLEQLLGMTAHSQQHQQYSPYLILSDQSHLTIDQSDLQGLDPVGRHYQDDLNNG